MLHLMIVHLLQLEIKCCQTTQTPSFISMPEAMGALVMHFMVCSRATGPGIGLRGNKETYYVHPGSHHFMDRFAVTRLEILAERFSHEVEG